MRQFSPKQLEEYLLKADPQPVLLDVREPWEVEICRIEDSINIPMGEIVARAIELDPKKEIVVICHHGVRSMQVALYLTHQGFENVINLRGGVDAWAQQVDPNMAMY